MYFNKIKMGNKNNTLNFTKNYSFKKNPWNLIKRKKVYLVVISYIMSALIFLFTFTGCYINLPFKLTYTGTETDVQYENDFTLLGLDKNEVSLHDFKGKLVVLNFWATWCPPCREEIPDFVEVYNMYKDKNVQFIGVADDDARALVNFISEYNINYPILVDGTVDRVFQKWGIDAIPHTFILDGNGNIMFDQLGMMTKSQLISAIENSLAQLD